MEAISYSGQQNGGCCNPLLPIRNGRIAGAI
jgi:hypothetical protein